MPPTAIPLIIPNATRKNVLNVIKKTVPQHHVLKTNSNHVLIAMEITPLSIEADPLTKKRCKKLIQHV